MIFNTNGISQDSVPKNIVANNYSSSSTYQLGEYCWHDNKLYRCTTIISTAENWTAAHWTEVSIGDELSTRATKQYVDTSIANLPEPMLFKGSVGTGGTITSLPAAAAANEGFTYKVISALSSPVTAKVGDTVISNGSAWTVIPSGDEPSGTVTNIATGSGLTGGPITTTGTISLASAYGDTVNPYGSKTKNYVLAGPSTGSNAAPTFRALVADDIPTLTISKISDFPDAVNNNTTGISISNHSTTTIYGVKSGSNSTTTASKASGSNGTAPSLTFAIDGTNTKQLNITWSAGSASTWSFTDVTVPIRADSSTTVVTSGSHSITDNGHNHTIDGVTYPDGNEMEF